MAESAPLEHGTTFRVLTIGDSDPRYAAAREVRYAALYEPWGLSRELTEDTDQREYIHFAVVDRDDVVIGYARLDVANGESKAFQVAVETSWRGRGVGRALMESIAQRARTEGRDFLRLDARDYAVGFYRRLGYETEGETFISGRTGTPHRRMRRSL